MSQTNRNTSGLKPAWQPGQSGHKGLSANGMRHVLSLARKNSVEAMQTVIDCMRDPTVPWPSRLAACEVIIDRAWGKALERVQLNGGDGIATLKIEFVDPRTAPDADAATITVEAAPRSLGRSPDHTETFEVSFAKPEEGDT